MFEKTFFLDENFFDEVKKCLIELYPKKWRFQVFATGERKIDKHIKRQFKRVSLRKIVISHCKGPDYMILLFYFDGFCDCDTVINTSRSNPGQKNK